MTVTSQKKVIIVAGPTAVGKTAVAIALAQYFNTSIISADSRQCYREMNLGVARPDPEELKEVPHHFIASHTVTDNVTAAGFEKYALDICEREFADKDFIIMAGGTGLYIKAFAEGLDDLPEATVECRKEIKESYKAGGMDWLKAAIESEDPLFQKAGETMNPQRMMRALEVKRTTGRSILEFHAGEVKERPFSICRIALSLPRPELLQRIKDRVNRMFDAGLVEEVRSLIPYRELPALQTVGYTEVFEYLDGRISVEEARELVYIHTRQYAKRQMTWFRREAGMHWFHPASIEEMIRFAESC